MTEPSTIEDASGDQPADANRQRRNKGSSLLGKAVLSLFALLVLFVVLELAMGRAGSAFSMETDPNYDRQERNYYPIETRLNPWAREGETPFKIGVIGDSFTNGAGVPYQDKYAVRLEALLNLNEGVRPGAVKLWAKGGTSTYEHYRFLKHAIAWEPDVVVLGICLNDTEDHQKRKTHTEWRGQSMPQPPKGFLKWLTGWSNVASFVYSKKEMARSTRAHKAYYQLLYQEDYHGYKKFVGYLGEIKKDLDQHDIKFFVMIWPLLGDLNPETYTFYNIHEKVHAILEGHGIPYVDLLPAFLGKNPTRIQAIPFIDGHPSEIGQRMASEVLYRALLEQKVIPREYASQAASGPIAGGYVRTYELMNPATFVPLEEQRPAPEKTGGKKDGGDQD